MSFFLLVLALNFLPTILFYSSLAIGVMMLVISLGRNNSVRTTGLVSGTIPVAAYLAALAVAETREQLTSRDAAADDRITRLIMPQYSLGSDPAVILLAKGKLSSIIMWEKGRAVEATLKERGRCEQLVEDNYVWDGHVFRTRRSIPFSQLPARLLTECLKLADISPETAQLVMEQDDNLILLRFGDTTVGRSPTMLLDIEPEKGAYELRQRGPNGDLLIGYWQTYPSYPTFPPILSVKGFMVERVHGRKRPPGEGGGPVEFVLGVLGHANPWWATR